MEHHKMGKIMSLHLEHINQELKDKTPSEIISWAISFAKKPVITTNFRPYEVAILKAVTEVQKEIKVIWCDTGYNTAETYKHAEETIEKLNLNIHLYTPKQTTAHRNVVMGIPSIVFNERSFAWDVSQHEIKNSINRIPKLEQWLNDLAFVDWSIEEMKMGLPWLHLNKLLI